MFSLRWSKESKKWFFECNKFDNIKTAGHIHGGCNDLTLSDSDLLTLAIVFGNRFLQVVVNQRN